MKKNVLQRINNDLVAATVEMATAEEEAYLAEIGAMTEPISPERRLDEIEAALIELAAIMGGGE